MSLAAFFAAWLLCLGAAVSPGPAVLMAARVGLQEGTRIGLCLAAGIGLGAVCWALAALLGMSLLFQFAPVLLTGLKLCGAAYLIWLAYRIWRDADTPIQESEGAVRAGGHWGAFRLGVLTQLANPKPAVFFGAVFVGTIPPTAPIWMLVLLLALIFIGEFLWNASVARIFAMARTRAAYLSLKHVIDRVFGAMLAALGVKVAAL